MNMAVVIHELLAGVLFYTCFCRAVHMDAESTDYGILGAFYLLGLSSVVMIAAPIVSSWRPSIPSIFLMLAVIVVQIVTSRYWHAGVPEQFQVSSHEHTHAE